MPAHNAPATTDWTSPAYPPGDVLMLLDDLADIHQGLYLVHAVRDGWATLWALDDDPATERLRSTGTQTDIPMALFAFFMPTGIRLSRAH
jgi:hypothetical protein